MIINKKTFVLFSFIFFMLISIIAITAYTISVRQINHSFIRQQLSIASETIRLRLASVVNSELALVRKLADTPVIRQYFMNPHDQELESLARNEFNEYQEHFNLKVVFWVNDIDNIFYSTGNAPYVVNPDDPESYWYDLTLYRTEQYNFNINYNPNMQQINLWINIPVFNITDGRKYPLGMLGTGIDLTEFSDFIANAYKDFDENITIYTFNKYDEITTAADYDLVFNKVRLDEHLGESLASIMKVAPANNNFISGQYGEDFKIREGYFFIDKDKVFYISPIPEMEWYLAAYYPGPGLLAIDQSLNTVFFSMLFLILFILIIINIYIARSETALEKQNIQLIEANKKSEIASRAKSDFLAAMSHELRTPLNTIIGFSEIEINKSLQNEPSSAKQPSSMQTSSAKQTRDNVTRIHQSGLHLLRIINDILDLSKLDSGKFEINPEEYDTASMISSIVDMNMIRIGSKFIRFTLEISGDFPARLTGDELRVKQIMNNLLSNAIKYTKEGRVQLTISSKEVQDNLALVTFTVADTGIGIRAEDIGKLFVDYTQLDTRSNKEVEGTGLGLSISKKIAQMMGGDITVESDYGKGSCFTVFIFQQRCDTSVIGEETAAALRRCQHVPMTGSLPGIMGKYAGSADAPRFTILAVDDHLNNLLLIREQLKPFCIQVDTASSGQEALKKINAFQGADKQNLCYDLILMDHMMPGMDGIETMKAVRKNERYAKVPVIVLTANALRGMKEYYLEQGFTDFIAKPVESQTLNDIIRKWLIKTGDKKPDAEEGGFSDGDAACAVFTGEIIKQRVDMLNHLRAAFEINAGSGALGRKIDDEYFRRLSDLLESFKTMPQSEQITALPELISAAQRKDADAVISLLGSCRGEFRAWAENQTRDEPAAAEIVQRLRKALEDGDTEAAGKTVKELGTAALTPAERVLYFNIYDALMDDDNHKALERIKEWLE